MMSYFKKKHDMRIDQQFLAGGSFSNWIQLIRENGGIDLRYLARSTYISIVALFGTPFRVYENWRYYEAIEKTTIEKPPVFILGHWRSGTTHVHRMMAQNPNFSIVTFVHTMIPGLFLTGRMFKYLLKQSLPDKRPMDNVTVRPEDAEEEEYALGNLGPYSFYHALSFPKKIRHIFDRYVVFEGATDAEIQRWQTIYMRFLKKVTFSSSGKQLLLKNPANTGRIKVLLEMFPNAKFVHVYRNPYIVYSSTMNWLDKEMAQTALQEVNETQIREAALTNYEKLMHKYLEERHLIPEENLYEVRFEDVETDPWGELHRIYDVLGLELDARTERRTARYLKSVAGYKKNKYQLDRQTIQEITRRWGFVINRWHYEPPQM